MAALWKSFKNMETHKMVKLSDYLLLVRTKVASSFPIYGSILMIDPLNKLSMSEKGKFPGFAEVILPFPLPELEMRDGHTVTFFSSYYNIRKRQQESSLSLHSSYDSVV
jgi:hypothetical protein